MARAIFCLTLLMSLLWVAPADARESVSPQEALNKQMPAFAARGSFVEVLNRFGQQAGVMLEPDWASLAVVGVGRDKPLDVAIPSGLGANVLDVLLSKAGASMPLAWRIDGERVRISTQAGIMGHSSLPASPVLNGIAPAQTAKPGTPTTAPTSGPASGAAPAGRSLATSIGDAVKFDNMPFGDVIDYFRALTGANFNVQWRSLELVGVTRHSPVTLRLAQATVEQALDLVLDQLSAGRDKFGRLYWVLDDGIITIATGDALNTTIKTRMMDVSDTLVTVPNFPGPRMQQETSSGNGRSSTGGSFLAQDQQQTDRVGEPSQAQSRQQARDNLVAVIKDSIGQDMWQPVGKGSIRFVGNTMVIAQTPLGFKLMDKSMR